MTNEPLHIETATREDWSAALQLLFAPFGEHACKAMCVDALTRLATTGGMEGLFVTRNAANKLTGVVLAYEAPGRIGTLHPPQVTEDACEGTASALLLHACENIARLNVPVLQAVVPSEHAADTLLLQETGFARIARLLLMVAPAGSFPASRPQLPFELLPYSPDLHRRFEQAVDASYEGSQDCPAVDGARQTADVLDGYRASGVFRNDWWLLIRHGQRDAGVLLISDFPQHQNAELAYMGLAPAYRGNGFGLLLTRYALWLAGREGRQQMVLAVDEKNQPALDLYTAAGFSVWSDREVYIKTHEASA